MKCLQRLWNVRPLNLLNLIVYKYIFELGHIFVLVLIEKSFNKKMKKISSFDKSNSARIMAVL